MNKNDFTKIKRYLCNDITKQDSKVYYCERLDSRSENTKHFKSVESLCALTREVGHQHMEILREDRFLRPYFDYDCKISIETEITNIVEEKKRHYERCHERFVSFFGHLNIHFDIKEHISSEDRSGYIENGMYYKISFHFLIIDGTYTTVPEMKCIVNAFDCFDLFDKAVYTKNRKMGLLYGVKKQGDTRVMLPIEMEGYSKKSHKDYIIQNVSDCTYRLSFTDSSITIPSLLSNTKGGVNNNILCSELMFIEPLCPFTEKTVDFETFDKYNIANLLSLIPNDGKTINYNTWLSIAFSMIEAKKKKETKLTMKELCQLFINFSSTYPSFDKEKDIRTFNDCSKKNGMYNIGLRYMWKLIEKLRPGFWEAYDKHENMRDNVKYDEVYEMNNGYKPYPMTEKRLICVRGNPGTGKTEQTEREVRKIVEDPKNTQKRFVMISYSRQLCLEYYRIFKKHGFKLYSKESDLDSVDKLIVCLDSLHKIQHTTFDYVIIDEATSVLKHFQSSVMKYPTAVSIKLKQIVQKSFHILLIDANIHRRSVRNVIQWIEKQNDVKAYWIHNTYVRETNRKVYMRKEKSKKKTIAFIINKLQEGKRVVVPCSSKDFAESLRQAIIVSCPLIKVKKYDSDTSSSSSSSSSKSSEEEEHEFFDVNKEWLLYDCIIYTPSISAGVSFTMKHFHLCVGVFESSEQFADVDTCYQQLFRVRQLMDGDMYIFLRNIHTYKNLPITDRAVESALENNLTKVLNFHQSLMTNFAYDYTEGYNTKSFSHILLKELIISKNTSLMYFESMLKELLKENKIPCVDFTDDEMATAEEKEATESLTKVVKDKSLQSQVMQRVNKLFDEQRYEEILTVKDNSVVDECLENTLRANIELNMTRWNISDLSTIDRNFFKKCIACISSTDKKKIKEMKTAANCLQQIDHSIQEESEKMLRQMRGEFFDTSSKDGEEEGTIGEENSFDLYRLLKRKSLQKKIATKHMMMYVFESENEKLSQVIRERHLTKKWKPRLIKYITNMKKKNYEYMLSLFDLDKVKHTSKKVKGKVVKNTIDYKNIKSFTEKGSNMCSNLIKKMVSDTFGLDFKNDVDHKYMTFDCTTWDMIVNNSPTFRNHNDYSSLFMKETEYSSEESENEKDTCNEDKNGPKCLSSENKSLCEEEKLKQHKVMFQRKRIISKDTNTCYVLYIEHPITSTRIKRYTSNNIIEVSNTSTTVEKTLEDIIQWYHSKDDSILF